MAVITGTLPISNDYLEEFARALKGFLVQFINEKANPEIANFEFRIIKPITVGAHGRKREYMLLLADGVKTDSMIGAREITITKNDFREEFIFKIWQNPEQILVIEDNK